MSTFLVKLTENIVRDVWGSFQVNQAHPNYNYYFFMVSIQCLGIVVSIVLASAVFLVVCAPHMSSVATTANVAQYMALKVAEGSTDAFGDLAARLFWALPMLVLQQSSSGDGLSKPATEQGFQI